LTDEKCERGWGGEGGELISRADERGRERERKQKTIRRKIGKTVTGGPKTRELILHASD